MDFYTFFKQHRGQLLISGYDKGTKVNKKIPIKPYLFLEDKDGDYSTIDNKKAKKRNFNSVREARDFIKKYENVENFNLYGSTYFDYVAINDMFPEVNGDLSKIKFGNIDIETDSEDGFADVNTADKPITSFQIKIVGSNRAIVLGLKDWTPILDKDLKKEAPGYIVAYKKCKDEKELLMKFIEVWRRLDIDFITGWNCVPLDGYVQTKNDLTLMGDLEPGDVLHSQDILETYPVTNKIVYETKLANGKVLRTSGDHKILIRSIPEERYTNFSNRKKDLNDTTKFLPVKDVEFKKGYTNFAFVRKNVNKNCDVSGITDDQLYMMGFIFTDGTLLRNGDNIDGFRVYQSDYELLETFNNVTNTKIRYAGKCNYSRNIRKSYIGDNINYVYSGFKKQLNVNKLSKLSYRQFMIFLSGMLDGDGFISQNTIALCNYDNQIDNIQLLLEWNGIFSSIESNHNIIRLQNFNFEDLKLRKSKRWGCFKPKSLKRCSSNKAKSTTWKEGVYNNEEGWWIKVGDVSKSNEIAPMIDIKTSNSEFVYNGVLVHNCDGYDIPYIIRRIDRVLGREQTKRLSPYNLIESRHIENMFGESEIFEIVGIPSIDYMELYKKFSFKNQESFKLDYICHVELDKKKLDYSEYKTLDNLYKKNPSKFYAYGVIDIIRIDELEKKLKMLELVVTLAHFTKTNALDGFATVKPVDVYIHNKLIEDKKVVPFNKKKEVLHRKIAGGCVKDPTPNLYSNIMSFDFTSLYPFIIRAFNVSHDTYLGKIDKYDNLDNIDKVINGEYGKIQSNLKKKNACITAKGTIFDRSSKGFLNDVMERGFNLRSEYKTKMIEAKKQKSIVEKLIKERENIG